MTKKEVMKKMRDALRIHYQWARFQRRRRENGKKAIPNVGGETFHREWVKVYKETLRILNNG